MAWHDNTEQTKDTIFRLALVLEVPFDRFKCEINIKGDDFEVVPRVEDVQLIDLWEVKQRAYLSGQLKTAERVAIRDAYFSALNLFYIPKEEQKEGDYFKNDQLSVAYEMSRPLSEYSKARREYVKKNKKGKI